MLRRLPDDGRVVFPGSQPVSLARANLHMLRDRRDSYMVCAVSLVCQTYGWHIAKQMLQGFCGAVLRFVSVFTATCIEALHIHAGDLEGRWHSLHAAAVQVGRLCDRPLVPHPSRADALYCARVRMEPA
jgi:hypothetical protein